MSIVRRCPNCGTTQSTAGECNACHEAQVRYSCTNHEPAIWLDEPTCRECVARSAPPRRPIAPAPVAPPFRRSSPVRPSPVDERALDVPPQPALWEKLLRGAVLARRADSPAARETSAPERGWIARLIIRLVLIAAVLGVGFVVAVYLVARSL